MLRLNKTCLLFFVEKLINLFVSFFGPGEGATGTSTRDDVFTNWSTLVNQSISTALHITNNYYQEVA